MELPKGHQITTTLGCYRGPYRAPAWSLELAAARCLPVRLTRDAVRVRLTSDLSGSGSLGLTCLYLIPI